MSVTRQELECFHRFAERKLGNGGAESISDLAHQWQIEREQEEVHEALREATDDLRAGRYRPAEDVSSDLRRKYNLPEA